MLTGAIQDGNLIAGTWINKRTNKKIVVRDMYFENDSMFIITSDGDRIDGNDFSSNYLQVSEQNEDAAKIENVITENKQPKDDLMFEGMDEFASAPAYNKNQNSRIDSENNIILNKLFKDNEIKCKAAITWTVPKDALKTARDFLGVSEEEIVNYIMNHISLDKEDLLSQVKKYLN